MWSGEGPFPPQLPIHHSVPMSAHAGALWPQPHAKGEEGCQGFSLPPGLERATEFSDAFGIVLLSSCKVKGEFPLTAVGTHLGLHRAQPVFYKHWSFVWWGKDDAGLEHTLSFLHLKSSFLVPFLCVCGPQPKCVPRV